ncbi:MAG: hypothetical protein K8R59_07070, partial [Thermoanaerobaculales bacterium]|nr:hypothetical protein [Thermoanaerobaculales bacterium]
TNVAYIPTEDEGFLATMTLHNIQPGTARYYVDILPNEFLPGWVDSSMGYFVITGVGDSKLPSIVARTYNKDVASGGTFGQNIIAFQNKNLILEGSEGYIPGVAVSADSETGFRTNIGLLNTNETSLSQVRVSVHDEGGNLGGEAEIWLEPGQFYQPNLVDRLGIVIGSPEPIYGSVVIEVLYAGPVAAYASVIDNGTQDPIQIPAVPAIEW